MQIQWLRWVMGVDGHSKGTAEALERALYIIFVLGEKHTHIIERIRKACRHVYRR